MSLKSYVHGTNPKDLSVFDQCIRDYICHKYGIDLCEGVPCGSAIFDKYEVLHFHNGNKDQFVDKNTKEILIEVIYLMPEFSVLNGNFEVLTKEYWR